MSANRIIGPFWIESCGETTTVNKERYIAVLEKFMKVLGRTGAGGDQGSWWFEQDGASPHTSRLTLITWLEDRSGDRISRKTRRGWPPHSPDLTPLNFFLWGYLKSKVYAGDPQNLDQLNHGIISEVRRINCETCAKVLCEVGKKANMCPSRKGALFKHLL